MKLDLLTNATVVDDAIRFVNTCAIKEDENDKESKEQPDYDDKVNEKSDDKEKQEKQKGEGGKIVTTTHNQLF